MCVIYLSRVLPIDSRLLSVSSSIELSSKHITGGSVKLVYSLIYTIFLVRFPWSCSICFTHLNSIQPQGMGLQYGSDLMLVLLPAHLKDAMHLDHFSMTVKTKHYLSGSWLSDNGTDTSFLAHNATWSFTHTITSEDITMFKGCVRSYASPIYLQPIRDWWPKLILVPLFAILVSMMLQQRPNRKAMAIQVIISCAAFFGNFAINEYLISSETIVSATGAFIIGLVGTIIQKHFGGTGFTSMLPAILFLVPSGLSSSGGLAGDGTGIELGRKMVEVTVGITVGLFMGQAVAYLGKTGSRQNVAFSF